VHIRDRITILYLKVLEKPNRGGKVERNSFRWLSPTEFIPFNFPLAGTLLWAAFRGQLGRLKAVAVGTIAKGPAF
jgi:hypothetical protein